MKTEPETSPPSPPALEEKRSLLPDAVSHPLTMLLAVVIPQIILLIINLNAWHLISGEVDAEQRGMAIGLFAFQLVLLISGAAGAAWFWRKQTRIWWALQWLIVGPAVGYLVASCYRIHEIIPDSLQTWIVQPAPLVGMQFIFIMPAAFLAALNLACFRTRLSAGKDVGFSLGAGVGVPLLWFFIAQMGAWHIMDGRIVEVIVIGLFCLSSMVCVVGIVRCMVMLFTRTMKSGPVVQWLLVALIAIVGPVGGLLLNKTIPFPADFQSHYFYILAIGNGLVLSIPRLGSETWDRVVWLGQCLFFCFTVYFFLVFLPYLPLSILAMIVMGAGFLILVPTLLFVVHLQKLAAGMSSPRWIAIGVGATLLVPAYLYLEAKNDRRVLNQAIDYVYSPDLSGAGADFRGSKRDLKRSLLRLQQIKHGRYLPFLTEMYNQVVLDGLVLSDAKMVQIHTAFFGTAMPVLPVDHDRGSGSFFSPSLSVNAPRLGPPPHTDVDLVDVETKRTVENGMVRTLVTLELHNDTGRQGEFATTIAIPDGMFVSGYWLHIEDERVPGRIFEKKTAMWVYRMIRDATRRDPGLLTYDTPNQLSLRVFPMEANQTRVTVIEFLSPVGYDGALRIGERTLRDPSEAVGGVAIAPSAGDTSMVLVAGEHLKDLPRLKRQPYLRIIVDRSATGLDNEAYQKAIQRACAKFADVDQCLVSFANYRDQMMNGGEKVAVADLQAILAGYEAPALAGGFLQSRLLKADINRSYRDDETECPIYVFLLGVKTAAQGKEKLDWFRAQYPDYDCYFQSRGDAGQLQVQSLQTLAPTQETEQREVCLLRRSADTPVVAVRLDVRGQDRAAMIEGSGPLQVYDESQNGFRDIAVVSQIDDSHYQQAVFGRQMSLELKLNPARTAALLPRIVEHSRDSGVLLPDTAYIVVENTAQWKVLEQKEGKKLKGNHALDHMKTPEPIWLVVIAYGGYLLYGQLRQRRRRLGVCSV